MIKIRLPSKAQAGSPQAEREHLHICLDDEIVEACDRFVVFTEWAGLADVEDYADL